MRSPIALEPMTVVPHTGSYILSYPHLLSYFSERELLSVADVVRGAHMAYGWMPTILDINPGTLLATDLQMAAEYLNKARLEPLSIQDLDALKRLVNNSIVGASKLLHFVAPERYAVWDSRVFAFCHDYYGSHNQVNSLKAYQRYLGKLEGQMTEQGFFTFHQAVCQKVGYSVSGLRALELIMFLNAPVRPSKRKK